MSEGGPWLKLPETAFLVDVHRLHEYDTYLAGDFHNPWKGERVMMKVSGRVCAIFIQPSYNNLYTFNACIPDHYTIDYTVTWNCFHWRKIRKAHHAVWLDMDIMNPPILLMIQYLNGVHILQLSWQRALPGNDSILLEFNSFVPGGTYRQREKNSHMSKTARRVSNCDQIWQNCIAWPCNKFMCEKVVKSTQ